MSTIAAILALISVIRLGTISKQQQFITARLDEIQDDLDDVIDDLGLEGPDVQITTWYDGGANDSDIIPSLTLGVDPALLDDRNAINLVEKL